MRKIVIVRGSGKDRKIGICTKGIILSHHPSFRDGMRKISRWMIYEQLVLKRKRVK